MVLKLKNEKKLKYFKSCNVWDITFTRPDLIKYLNDIRGLVDYDYDHRLVKCIIERIESLGYWNVQAKSYTQMINSNCHIYIPSDRKIKFRNKKFKQIRMLMVL